MFSLEFIVDDQKYCGEGETIPEALERIDLQPKLVKTVYVCRAKYGDQTAELKVYPRLLKRLLVKPASRTLFEKHLKQMLKIQ